MRETTDTSNKYGNGKEIEDGQFDFTVVSVKKKYGGKDKNSPFFVWTLTYGVNNEEVEQVLMPNMMGGLLKALSCTEIEPNKFDWDTDAQGGKQFTATVSHEPDKKDPSKIRQKMGDFKAVEGSIPF